MKVQTLLFLIDKENSTVLLAMKKRGFGVGKWNGVGGKVERGEAIGDAVLREAKEEMGISGINIREILKFYKEETNERGRIKKRFNMLYDAIYDGTVDFDKEEVAEIKWILPATLEVWMQDEPDDFTPAFIHTYQLYKEKLEVSEK